MCKNREKSNEDATKENRDTAKVKCFTRKHLIFLVLAIFLPPIIILLITHLGNFINYLLPWFNINPVGIDNAVWFGFWGSFLGGICTLIAFYFTFKQNQKNVNDTINANKKQFQMQIIADTAQTKLQIEANAEQMKVQIAESQKQLQLQINENKSVFEKQLQESRKEVNYQNELNNINEERKVISSVVRNLNPLDIVVLLNRFDNLPFVEWKYDKYSLNELVATIRKSQENLTSDMRMLGLESNIANSSYKTCKNSSICKLGQICENFMDTYYKSYTDIFNSYNNLLQYIEYAYKKRDAEMIILEQNQKIEKFNEDTDKEYMKMGEEIISHYENYLVDNPNLLKIVSKDIENMQKIHDTEINNMIIYSKQYIVEKKKILFDKLNGMKILSYEEDETKKEN